ncbi:uncharacterized protein LOC119431818 [Dermacentor silvarum]|uniref:uncharacterized protein LOC119431818 n=1 Tax=Dermacentor silvarum TaxID=543639 RepID=UPI00189AC615|nr:uncharacterized protein LOC119431818 [Dermacentor silvarum]
MSASESRPEGNQGLRASPSTAYGEKRSKHKKRKKSAKREDVKQDVDEAPRPAQSPAPAADSLESPAACVELPKDAEKIPASTERQRPEEEKRFSSARCPSAFRRVVGRLTMPLEKLQVPTSAYKDVKPCAEPAETSEVFVRTSENTASATRRKSSVRFGATTLQAITPTNFTRSTSADRRLGWRTTGVLIAFAIVAAASLGVFLAVYVLHSRKHLIEHCASVECKFAVEDMISHVDPHVSPCDDFYLHVCGKAGDKTFGGADLMARALDDVLISVQRVLRSRKSKDHSKHPGLAQLATTFTSCYAFAISTKALADAPLAEAIADETDILGATDVASVLRRVIRLSLRKGISTLFTASGVIYLGDLALHVSRGKSFSEKLAQPTDGAAGRELVTRLFDRAFANTPSVRKLDANDTVRRLLEFDRALSSENSYARDEEMCGDSKTEFVTQYVGGRDWLRFVNSLLPENSQLKEASLVLVSEADRIKKAADELRKKIDLGVIYILFHVAMEIGRFYIVPLSKVTRTCLRMAQEILPPSVSNVFHNLTTTANSDPSRAGAIFIGIREVFAKHPLMLLGISEGEEKKAASFLGSVTLRAQETTVSAWPNGSGWQPHEAADSLPAAFPRMHVVLKAREALRRLNDPPSVGQVTFSGHELTNDVVYSRLLNEVFLPASLRRSPVLYSGQVPTEFNMGTVGVLLATQVFHANEPSENDLHDWYDQNAGAFGRCMRESKPTAIAWQFNALPDNRLLELFTLAYSVKVAHRAVREHYDGYDRHASNFDDVLRKAQRTFFRRFCLLSCGDSVQNETSESRLACLVPVLNMPEFYEAFGCPLNKGAEGRCAPLS